MPSLFPQQEPPRLETLTQKRAPRQPDQLPQRPEPRGLSAPGTPPCRPLPMPSNSEGLEIKPGGGLQALPAPCPSTEGGGCATPSSRGPSVSLSRQPP